MGLHIPPSDAEAKGEADSHAPTQAAAVVSRRVGPAVVRNKVKRRLREIYRHELPLLKRGLWIVVTAKPGAAAAPLSTLRSEWLRLASRLSIFANS